MKVELASDLELPLRVAGGSARQAHLLSAPRRLVRHRLATDQVLYSVAAGAAETRLLVRALRAQHDLVAARIAEVKRADSSAEFAASAHALVGSARGLPSRRAGGADPRVGGVAGSGPLGAGRGRRDPARRWCAERTGGARRPRDPARTRHPRIFGIYARLAPGESFVLVNNHDPKPLRREFQATYPDRFGWGYLEAGPERWRVRIGRLPVDA